MTTVHGAGSPAAVKNASVDVSAQCPDPGSWERSECVENVNGICGEDLVAAWCGMKSEKVVGRWSAAGYLTLVVVGTSASGQFLQKRRKARVLGQPAPLALEVLLLLSVQIIVTQLACGIA
jgi:hypothetical protein